MKRNGISLLICFLLLCVVCTGCVRFPSQHKPVISDETVHVSLYAKDYIDMEKAQIESLLGGFVQEEYYNGGLVYQFTRSDMWFWFGTDAESYADVPADAQCCFVMASLRDAAAFKIDEVTGDDLSKTLGFPFGEPTYSEMDDYYCYYAEKDGVSCLVSCQENGIASPDEDFVIYSIIR